MNLSKLFKKYWIYLFIYFLLGFIIVVLPIYELYLANLLIDSIVNGNGSYKYLYIFIGTNLGLIICYYVKFRYRNWLELKWTNNIRALKTTQLTNGAFDKHLDSEVIKSKLINNPPIIVSGALFGAIDLLNTTTLLACASALLFTYHWILATVAIGFSLLCIIITILFSKPGAKYNLAINQISNSYNSDAKRMINLRNQMFLFKKINFFNSLILNLTISKNKEVFLKYKKIIYFNIPILILGFIMQVLAPLSSAILASNGMVSISVIAISSFIYGIVFSSLISVPQQIKGIVNSKSILKDLFNNSKIEKEEDNKIKKINLVEFSPIIKKRIFFSKKMNLTIKIGDKIQLTGPNGSGKSSLIESIKNNENYDGKIKTTPSVKAPLILDKKIAFITEHVHIFNGTLKDNITIFSNDKTDKIKNIMNDLNIKIELNKVISAEKVSDGERQKIALARAILTDPNFIFIDEGLNNISVLDRNKINKYLLKMDAAIILVSHKETGGGYEKVQVDK